MKRINSSDSLGVLISMCPTEEGGGGAQEQVYTREYQTMMEGCVDEEGHVGEKKRRLSVEQVKALERNFEVENKLEPERKVKLAQELGLQPRQVAVWFQNRRARWKTKQLERDYGVLKSNFDALQLNYDSLLHDNQALLLEIKELKSKLEDEKTETNLPIKEETLASESDQNPIEMITEPDSLTLESQQESFNFKGEKNRPKSPVLFTEYKLDGPSDSSDSSAILNDDQSPNASNSSSGVLQNHPLLFNSSSSSSPPSINGFSFNDSRSDGLGGGSQSNNVYEHTTHFVKMEEHNFFGGDEACNFFSEEPAPTLSWYNDQWT